MVRSCGRAGCLTAENGGFRPGAQFNLTARYGSGSATSLLYHHRSPTSHQIIATIIAASVSEPTVRPKPRHGSADVAGDLKKFYDLLLPFLTGKPLDQSLIEAEAVALAGAAAADEAGAGCGEVDDDAPSAAEEPTAELMAPRADALQPTNLACRTDEPAAPRREVGVFYCAGFLAPTEVERWAASG